MDRLAHPDQMVREEIPDLLAHRDCRAQPVKQDGQVTRGHLVLPALLAMV